MTRYATFFLVIGDRERCLDAGMVCLFFYGENANDRYVMAIRLG